jgi:hypothetical protein
VEAPDEVEPPEVDGDGVVVDEDFSPAPDDPSFFAAAW